MGMRSVVIFRNDLLANMLIHFTPRKMPFNHKNSLQSP